MANCRMCDKDVGDAGLRELDTCPACYERELGRYRWSTILQDKVEFRAEPLAASPIARVYERGQHLRRIGGVLEGGSSPGAWKTPAWVKVADIRGSEGFIPFFIQFAEDKKRTSRGDKIAGYFFTIGGAIFFVAGLSSGPSYNTSGSILRRPWFIGLWLIVFGISRLIAARKTDKAVREKAR
jgi:hypothetical protein